MTRTLRLLLLLVVAAITGACPPAPDPAESIFAPPPTEATSGGESTTGETAGPPVSPMPTVADDGTTLRPVRTGESAPVVYEPLRGGTFVPRCPACGEVQPEGSAKCAACSQPISSWRKEWACGRCAGDGSCDHCGEDRVCLACDGDGKCIACSGSGKIGARGVACAECGGNGSCASCRGDGRRDAVTGDFLPNEGTLAGACPTCIDGSGLCPECGSSGKDPEGAKCPTCAGDGVCPDCHGEGTCAWCGTSAACIVCAGSGREVRNGALRGPTDFPRTIRTSAGTALTVRFTGPPAAQSIRVMRADGGNVVQSGFARGQLSPLSWLLAIRAFPPGWDGRTTPESAEVARFQFEVADEATQAGQWVLALAALRAAAAADPGQSPSVRVKVQEVESKRVEQWMLRAESAVKDGDLLRAVQLFEMCYFKGRGSGTAMRAELRILAVRKDREQEIAKLDETARMRRAADSTAAGARAVARAKRRLERSRLLAQRATTAPDGDPTMDRTFARAEAAAWAARRITQQAAFRDPPTAIVAWETTPEVLVTEARLASSSVLEAWAVRAAGAGRFGLAVRLARRGLESDASSAALKQVLTEAERGLVRSAVFGGTPPPSGR